MELNLGLSSNGTQLLKVLEMRTVFKITQTRLPPGILLAQLLVLVDLQIVDVHVIAIYGEDVLVAQASLERLHGVLLQ